MRKLSLEEIREINQLEVCDMARIIDVSIKEYEYLKDHTGKLDVFKMMKLCATLKISTKYILI